MRILGYVCLLTLFGIAPIRAKTFDELFPGTSYESAEAQAFVEGLNFQQGLIKLPEAQVTLTVPASFYFLGAADSQRVLVDQWGNPPSLVEGVLGMLFPATATPIDADTWGATLTYSAEGYVEDGDAKGLDYDAMLADLKAATDAGNEERKKAGDDPITLVGWASPPYYDQPQHKLHWAKELKFGTAAVNTVNYDVRALGRNGVLELSFITDMDRLTAVKAAMPDVLAMASFDQGSRYEDFDSRIDSVAAYGIGDLIVGVAAKKPGLLAPALGYLQKFWIITAAALVAGLGALWWKQTRRGKDNAPTGTPHA